MSTHTAVGHPRPAHTPPASRALAVPAGAARAWAARPDHDTTGIHGPHPRPLPSHRAGRAAGDDRGHPGFGADGGLEGGPMRESRSRARQDDEDLAEIIAQAATDLGEALLAEGMIGDGELFYYQGIERAGGEALLIGGARPRALQAVVPLSEAGARLLASASTHEGLAAILTWRPWKTRMRGMGTVRRRRPGEDVP